MSKTVYRPHVALIVETSLAPGREMLLGIADFVREHGPWSIYLEPRTVDTEVPCWIHGWQGHGIIARVYNHRIAEAIAETRLPVVDVLGRVAESSFPLVHVDDRAIGRLAAEHLIERRFRQFAFCGLADEAWSKRRGEAFADVVTSAGGKCHHMTIAPNAEGETWEQQQDELENWISHLPQPVGVMAACDPVGNRLLEAARRANVIVPEQFAVIGVDNDEPLCLLSDPPMSSIVPDHRAVGYMSAALLTDMMQGKAPPASSRYLAPTGIVARRSTDALAVDDADVRAALRYIRENTHLNLTVADVVAHVNVSRSTLKRKFASEIHRSIHEEIIAVRMRQAKELLRSTALSVAEIAARTGYEHPEYFGVVFKSHVGIPPGEFRDLGDNYRS